MKRPGIQNPPELVDILDQLAEICDTKPSLSGSVEPQIKRDLGPSMFPMSRTTLRIKPLSVMDYDEPFFILNAEVSWSSSVYCADTAFLLASEHMEAASMAVKCMGLVQDYYWTLEEVKQATNIISARAETVYE